MFNFSLCIFSYFSHLLNWRWFFIFFYILYIFCNWRCGKLFIIQYILIEDILKCECKYGFGESSTAFSIVIFIRPIIGDSSTEFPFLSSIHRIYTSHVRYPFRILPRRKLAFQGRGESATNGENRDAYVVNYDADTLQYHSLSAPIKYTIYTSRARFSRSYDTGGWRASRKWSFRQRKSHQRSMRLYTPVQFCARVFSLSLCLTY